MKKKLLLALLLVLSVLALSACKDDAKDDNNDDTTSDDGSTDDGSTDDGSTDDGSTDGETAVYNDVVKINFTQGKADRMITYQKPTKLVLPDGTEIVSGDIKPTWATIASNLGLTIQDDTTSGSKSTEMLEAQAATGFKDSDIYGGNGIAEKLMNYGVQGQFINLLDYLDYMPNYSAYLTERPDVKAAITAADGGIYHVPYVAEINNFAKVFDARATWVTLMLDGDGSALEAETKTLTTEYNGYWAADARGDYDHNVITLQNAAAGSDNLLSMTEARTALLDYIAQEYPDYTNPSELFLGDKADYDIDELVALWRVMFLAPNTLSKEATGSVVADATIVPYFVRKGRDREEYLRLINYFGGQRVFGSDSYNSRFHLAADGTLTFSYTEDKFLDGLDSLKALFSEGLLNQDLNDTSNSGFRTTYFGSDAVEANTTFGFMTYDWIASTTASNEDVVGVLPPVTTMANTDGEFIHFIENTRTIKSDGWAISANAENKYDALKLVDYLFSEEGNRLQNYGPFTKDGKTYEASNGTMYPEFDEWVLTTAASATNGDVAAFLRDYVGSHLAVGYQKEIGFELQYTTGRGAAAWELYYGTGSNTNDAVVMPTYAATDSIIKLVPPVFAIDVQDIELLKTLAIGSANVDEIFAYIVGDASALADTDAIYDSYVASGLNAYVLIYQYAYAVMTAE